MRKPIAPLAVLVVSLLPLAPVAQDKPAPATQEAPATTPARDDTAAEALGWHLGVQAWTFRDRTACEAIETTAKLGLKYIELYPGQALGPDDKSAKVGPGLSDAQFAKLVAKLESCKVQPVSFGVVEFGDDEVAARKIFAFAKKLGLKNISCEPAPNACELVDKLCNEYGINAAIHNHPKPSRYWNPDTVLTALNGRSQRMGSCSDTGHWSRSGLVPTECLKKLEGHIVELHFKDIADGVDRPWGTGKSDARAMLRELWRQKFRGLFSVEYEDGAGATLEANVARCVTFFDQTARELAASK